MTARVKVAALVDVSIPAGRVHWIRLSDGATLRATSDFAAELVTVPFAARVIAYDVDDAGNRSNPRLATAGEREAARAGWYESPRNTAAELERARDPRFADIPRRGER